MIVRELHVEYRPRPDLPPSGDRALNHPRDVAAFVRPLLEHQAVEVFLVLCLTTRHRVLSFHELGRGTLSSVTVSPREILQTALLANAAVVAVAHNHPSGDPTPSPDDVALTTRLVQAGEIVGIQVVDHLIVGEAGRYYSFSEGGRL